jgi:hypothetical protein
MNKFRTLISAFVGVLASLGEMVAFRIERLMIANGLILCVSTATNAQGTAVKIATGTGGAKTITGATQAYPCVITSTAHGLSAGDVGAIASVTGMTQLNGNTFQVQYPTTNAFALANVNSTAYTAYASGGTFTPVTFSSIGNVKGFNGFDGQASEIDVTNFASVAKEFRLGLIDNGQLNLDLHLDNGDAGQVAARAAQVASTLKNMQVVLPAGTTPTASFTAFVKQFGITGSVDNVVSANIVLRISGAVSWA